MECKDWLKGRLRDGECHLCDTIRSEASQEGFKKSELKKARKELGVRTWHQFDGDGATENWFWYL